MDGVSPHVHHWPPIEASHAFLGALHCLSHLWGLPYPISFVNPQQTPSGTQCTLHLLLTPDLSLLHFILRGKRGALGLVASHRWVV